MCKLSKKYYLILFISIIFQMVNEAIYKFNYYENIFDEVKIFHNIGHEYFSKHILIHLIFNYTGLFIFSIPFVIYDTKSYKLEKEKEVEEVEYEIRRFEKREVKRYFFILLIVFLWIAEEYLFMFYNFILGGLDYWLFELLIVSYLGKKIFHIGLYIHEKFAILINSFPFLLKFASIILNAIIKRINSDLIYIKHKWIIPVGILIYLILALIRSFVILEIRRIFDYFLISQNKLLMVYGLMGSIISLIFCIFTSIFNCNDGEIQNYFCNVSNNNNTDKYIDSFSIYYNTFQGYSNNDKTQIIIEILVIIFGGITFFIYKFLSLKVLSRYSYLNPVLFSYSFSVIMPV